MIHASPKRSDEFGFARGVAVSAWCADRERVAFFSRLRVKLTTERAGIELLAMLGALWSLLGLYASVARPLSLFGRELQKAEIAEFFRPGPRPSQVARVSATAPFRVGASASPEAASVSGKAVLDEAPQRILILGDSMIEGLLPRLADYAAENGHSLNAVIWYGSRTIDWANSSRLTEVLAAARPTFVIIALGSSELKVRDVEKRAVAVERMLHRIGSSKVLWIGPPNWTTDTGINALLERTLGSGRFFRSAELHFERKRDGIHPTLGSSERWLDAVVRYVVEESAVPIRLATPKKTGTPRPRVRVFSPPS